MILNPSLQFLTEIFKKKLWFFLFCFVLVLFLFFLYKEPALEASSNFIFRKLLN